MIVASRVERALSKVEILEFYLNSVYLGRGSWGIEMAARARRRLLGKITVQDIEKGYWLLLTLCGPF
jgi:membrane carboxypeptidase/penicillin-binding protein